MRILHLERSMPNNYLTVDVWDWGNGFLKLMLTVFYEGKGKDSPDRKQYFVLLPGYNGKPIELLMSIRSLYQEIQADETIRAGQLAVKQLFEL